ncbi:DUF551 domain-containing protein [Klebsiella michiganensis]|uniref:DUF551 domain-containing protein n=1 Tax=Klebsiella michiganensis TaxID=1134687 RepID=UPI00339C5409
MTSKLTRERLQEIAEDGFLKHGESKELARMALAAMDSEPVAWIAIYHGEVYDEAIGITRSVVEAQADHFGWESALTEIIPLYSHAQQPVVPPLQHWEELCREHPDMSIGDAIIRAAWWNHCRAAMLAASQHDTPALNSLQSVDSVAGKWIPVSERMPEEDTDVVVYCSDTEEQFVAYHNCNGYFHYATYEKKGEGYVDIVCNPTHWMPLPAAPQEVR